MRRPARRPLDPTELSWIIEQKILGIIPIRMFPPPESPSSQVIPLLGASEPASEEGEAEITKQSIGKK